MSYGQSGATNQAIISMPSKANGYLILDDVRNSNVKKWEVSIQEIGYDTTQNDYTFNTVDQFDLIGSYYSQFDERIVTNPDYFLVVKGLDGNNDEVVSEGPVTFCNDCISWWAPCYWVCEGTTYCYSLELWANPSNSLSKLKMGTYSSDFIDPFNYAYQWMSESEWQALNNNSSTMLGYYGLAYTGNTGDFPSFEDYLGNFMGVDRVIKLEQIQTTSGYYNSNNMALGGTIYGVVKHYGPWQNAPNQGGIESNVLIGADGNCTQNFNWAMNSVNDNSSQFNQSVPQLSCNGNSDVVWPDPEDYIAEDFITCYDDAFDDVFDANCEDGIYDAFQTMMECYENESPTVDTPFEWPDLLKAVTFKRRGDSPVTIESDKIFDSTGLFVGKPIVLAPGFQSVSFQIGDYAYKTFYYELTDTVFSSLQNKDFFSATVYPVPIRGNSFSLDMEASAKLKFTYKLYNQIGNLIYSKNYQMGKDSNITDTISVLGGIPNGNLINRFEFQDGSVYQFQTLK